jgi:hypothetical protein
MVLPVAPVPEDAGLEFKTRCGTVLGRGYVRVVIGGRGPYVEFDDSQIVAEAVRVPPDQAWRLDPKYVGHAFYTEWRSADDAFVKLYFQRKLVDYADYRLSHWYVSPFDLTTEKYPVLVKPLEKKARQKPVEPNDGDCFEGL